jgi:hypothetical protein
MRFPVHDAAPLLMLLTTTKSSIKEAASSAKLREPKAGTKES